MNSIFFSQGNIFAAVAMVIGTASCTTLPRFDRTGSHPADGVIVNADILTDLHKRKQPV